MKLILLLAVLPLLSDKCGKRKTAIPACINDKISEIKGYPKWNPPAEVNEYLFNGKRVFLFSSDCCDRYNELYDDECNYICAPSGGYAGTGDNKCRDFSEVAKHTRLVWKDDR
jgi:hypothetical protein